MSGPRPERLSFLTDRPFAHRGLHGAGVSENGMAAFDTAIAAGFGIECDVRASRDHVAFIFHDATLERMTAAIGAIDGHDAERLDELPLLDGSPLPRLATLLDRCGGQVPLLVEIKGNGRSVTHICRAVERDLARHGDTAVALMSFNPRAMRWFARHAPDRVRGLVVTQQGKGRVRGRLERALALWLAKPDFVACDIADLPSAFARRARQRGTPVLTWTVRCPDERARAAAHADQIIFERGHD